MQNIRAEVVLGTCDLRGDIAFFTNDLGFRMDEVFPADDPRIAVFSGYGMRVRLDQTLQNAFGTLRILGNDPVLIADGAEHLTSPGGTKIEIGALNPPIVMPPTKHAFVVRRLVDQAPWIIGRAGMHYRDLIPDRLGGSIIASHIRIPDGGPVPDMVHYHSVGFQLIFCVKGWVDLVYEDQGEPFRLHAGNCVIQPPEIRHRVLYASDNIEVIEIGVPAEHITTIDHTMALPTQTFAPDRAFSGQTFVHHQAQTAPWQPFRIPGFKARNTQIDQHTQNVAQVMVVRPDTATNPKTSHDADIHFTFVMAGSFTLHAKGHDPQTLGEGDACVIPPGLITQYVTPSNDLELLEVTLPGKITTHIHD